MIEARLNNKPDLHVRSVLLAIGQLSCVDADALAFCFPVVMKNSIIEGASLVIESVEAKACCEECGKVVTVQQRFERCPNCNVYLSQLIQGDECDLLEIEVL